MKYSLITLIVALSTAFAAPAVDLKKRSSGVLAVPVTHNRTLFVDANKKAASARRKRDDTYDVTIENDVKIGSYNLELDLGTPGQTQTVLLDTGSSDLWVYSSDTSLNSGDDWTTYDSSSSSTYTYLNSDFSISYVSGSASGDWVEDTVDIDGASITKQQFAVVSSDSGSPGILGVGSEAQESASTEYSNVPASLKSQGFIEKNLYSLYLDEYSADSGYVLFGGIDKAKYTGDLYKLSITSTYRFETNTEVVLGDTTTSSFGGILDSGTTLTYVPDDVYKAIGSYYGLTANSGYYFTDSIPSESITFNFSGAKIVVEAKEIFLESANFFSNAPSKYFLAILSNTGSSGYNLLGDTFLRSAYVVYDIEDWQLAIAQASWDSTTSDIVAVSGDIPGLVTP